MSFSKRSGVTGTDGWIAPEMFANNASVVKKIALITTHISLFLLFNINIYFLYRQNLLTFFQWAVSFTIFSVKENIHLVTHCGVKPEYWTHVKSLGKNLKNVLNIKL